MGLTSQNIHIEITKCNKCPYTYHCVGGNTAITAASSRRRRRRYWPIARRRQQPRWSWSVYFFYKLFKRCIIFIYCMLLQYQHCILRSRVHCFRLKAFCQAVDGRGNAVQCNFHDSGPPAIITLHPFDHRRHPPRGRY